MFRTFITAAVLALTVTAAQAEGIVTVHVGDLNPANAKDAQLLTARISEAAEAVCAPMAARGMLPISHYGAVFKACVYRTSNSAMTKYQAQAKATAAMRAQLAGK
jgi:UrcA family protein